MAGNGFIGNKAFGHRFRDLRINKLPDTRKTMLWPRH